MRSIPAFSYTLRPNVVDYDFQTGGAVEGTPNGGPGLEGVPVARWARLSELLGDEYTTHQLKLEKLVRFQSGLASSRSMHGAGGVLAMRPTLKTD